MKVFNIKTHKQIQVPIPEKYLEVMEFIKNWVERNPEVGDFVVGLEREYSFSSYDQEDLFMKVDGITFNGYDKYYSKQVPLSDEERKELAEVEIEKIRKEYGI